MARGKTRHVVCVVLSQTKLAEQDLILTMLCGDGGEVRAVAKGARKPGGRLAARVEPFCETELLLAKGRGSLDIVSEATTMDPHAGLRGDPDRVSAAFAVCEVARQTCFEEALDPFLYPVLSRTLTALEEAGDRAHLCVVVAAYVFKVLAHQGWRPELHACVSCGDEAVSRFSVMAGGALCESCGHDVEGAEPIDAGMLAWVSALINLTFDRLLAAPVDDATATALLGLAHRWATTHLDVRLRAMEFLLGV